MPLFSLCCLRITTQLRSDAVDKMTGIFTKHIWQPCICQPNELKLEIKKKTGGSNGGPSKNLGGHDPPRPPLESPLYMGQKAIIRFWWESGLSSAYRNHLTTFCRPFAHYTCLRLCFATVNFIRNNCLYLSAVAGQSKLRQTVGLENMNMTSNYDVTNNAHQIQMTP